MPESFSALLRIVSLTAAKTSRMFDVSVACVRLAIVSRFVLLKVRSHNNLLWVEVQVSPVDLIESPE